MRGGLRLLFWSLSAGFIGKWESFSYWSFSTKTVREREAYVRDMDREPAEFLWWFWWSMHAIYNNLGWLRSSQQLGASMAGFKTPQIERIVSRSHISSKIGFSNLE
jgi:hypothetical protein